MAADNHESFKSHPPEDRAWTEAHWQSLLSGLITSGVVTWQQVTSLVLGHLNPSQVGTSLASKPSFQRHFEKRKAWDGVRKWHFQQTGFCHDCKARLELQADHRIPKELVGLVGHAILNDDAVDIARESDTKLLARIRSRLEDGIKATEDPANIDDGLAERVAKDLFSLIRSGAREKSDLAAAADRLENMILRCRRCNVIRRPSHTHGGKTFLTAEAGLMWILFVKRPKTYQQFQKLCRAYGMTMACIRFEEAWAMARWLKPSGMYEIDADSKW